MNMLNRVVISACCVICLLYSTECAKSGFARMRRDVNYLLNSMHDLRQDVGSIRDAVDTMQQLRNSSDEQLTLTTEQQFNMTDIVSNALQSLTEKFESQLLTILEGFRKEKFNIRHTLNSNLNSMLDNVTIRIDRFDTLDRTLKHNVSVLHENVTSTIDTLETTMKDEVRVLQENITSRMDTVEMTMIDKVSLLEENITSRMNIVEMTTVDKFSVLQDSVIRSIGYINQTAIEKVNIFHDRAEDAVTAMNRTLTEGVEIMTGKIEALLKQVSDNDAANSEKIKELTSVIDNIDSDAIKTNTMTRLKEIGYTQHGNTLYKLYLTAQTWQKAEEQCKADGSHLVELDSKREKEFVKGMITGWVWIGGTDIGDEGSFIWSTTGLSVPDWIWRSGEPNNQGDEDCVHMNTDGANDYKCGLAGAYICEKEL